MHADRLTDKIIIALFYWNSIIIYQFCVFVHGKLFAVAFKISANVIQRNVMSVFENMYVIMLRISRWEYLFKQIYNLSCMTPLRTCANFISFLRLCYFQAKSERFYLVIQPFASLR